MGNSASILPEETRSKRIHAYAEHIVDESMNEYLSSLGSKIKPNPAVVPVPAQSTAYMPTVNMMPKMNFLNLTLKVEALDQPAVGKFDRLPLRPAPLPAQTLAGITNLKSVKSLRSFALQHRSRHENSYIPQETLVPRGFNKKTVEGRRSLTNVLNHSGNSHPGGSGKGIAASNEDSFSIDYDATVDRNVVGGVGDGVHKKKPALKLDVGLNNVVDVDEEDWIQVRIVFIFIFMYIFASHFVTNYLHRFLMTKKIRMKKKK